MLISKRDVLLCTGTLALMPMGGAAGQEAEELDILTKVAGGVHNETVLEARDSMVEGRPLGVESLHAAVDELVKLELLSEAAGEVLKAMISAILDGTVLDEIEQEVRRIVDQASQQLDQLAEVIANIALDTISLARELLSNESIQNITRAIASDVRGGLDGARAGAKLGAPIPIIGSKGGAIIGAVAGAGSASVLGYFERTA